MTVQASAPSRRSTRTRLRGETSRRVIATLISTGMVLQPIAASAGPTSGTVVGGNATITASGNTTTIEQIDARVVIDWTSFDIDSSETVKFDQPGTQSVALNRVLGELPSHIRGQLLANGHVWIVNRNGVTFHAGSVVNVGGLLATTSDITNADFMAGRNNFTIPGNDGATVTNHGSISFGDAGLAGLVAPGASNHGQIAGKLGTVIVAGEKTFAIDFAGDGMFAFEPKGAADFRGKATNTGSISNSGGYILIAARTASGMVDQSISLGGVVEATTAEMKDGRIVLSGGDGLVNVAGTLDASGGAGKQGGSVKVSGGRVNVASTGRIDVSGDIGGGTAEIGGGWQGASMGERLRNAQDTRVQFGAEIAADAGTIGNGGTAVVWADGSTGYAGTITATGGAHSGNGGTVEVSGKERLGFYGLVDTAAPNGESGLLLLDPENITVQNIGTADLELLLDNSISFGDRDTESLTLSATALTLATGQVNLRATNDIRFVADVNATQNLDIAAGNDILVGSSVTTTGNIKLVADASSAGGSATGAGPRNNDGTVVFNVNGSLRGQNIELDAGESMRVGDIRALGTLDATTTTGSITQRGGTNIVARGDATFRSEAGITLTQMPNNFDAGLTATTTGDNAPIQIVDTGDFSVTEVTAGTAADRGDVTLISRGNINLGDIESDLLTVTAKTGTFNISDRNAAGAGDTIDTDRAVLTATGDIVVDSPSNDFRTRVTARGKDVTIRDIDSVTLSNIDAADLDVAALAGEITQTGTGVPGEAVNASGTTTLSATAGVTLANEHNRFDGTVTAAMTGGAVSLRDADALTVGDVSAVGTLDLQAKTVLSQDAGTAITTTGAATLTADDAIALDQALNDFSAGVDATTVSAGAEISLRDQNALIVRSASAGLDGTRGNVTVQGGSVALGDIESARLIVTADRNDIVDLNTTTVDGAINTENATFDAPNGNVLLDVAENDFGGAIIARAGNVVLTDKNRAFLAIIEAETLSVTAGADIVQTGSAGQGIDVENGATLNAGTEITLENGVNDFGGAVEIVGTTVSVADANGIEVGAVTADSLKITAQDISVTGAVALGTGSATFVDSGTGPTVLGAAVADADESSFEISDADLANVASAEIAIESNGNAIDVQGAALGTPGQGLRLDGGGTGTVDFTTATTSTTGPSGNLTIRNAGNVSQTAPGNLAIDGVTNINVPGSSVTLNDAGNSFSGPVNVTGSDIDIAAAALRLGAVDASGDLTATSVGALTQNASGVTVAGETDLSGASITLGAANDFDSDDAGETVIATSAGAIVLNDVDDIALGNISAGNGLTVTANNTLTAPGNIVATGGNVILSATTGAVVLGNLTAPATLTVSAGTTITQDSGTTVSATGASTLTADDGIALQSTTNDFSSVTATTTAAGAGIALRDSNALTVTSADAGVAGAGVAGARGIVRLRGTAVELGDIEASNLVVTADTGNVTDIDTTTAGAAINTERATLLATAGDVIVDAVVNDFTDFVTAIGNSVTLADRNGIALANIEANALDVTARNGSITQSNTDTPRQAINTTTATLRATQDVTLANPENDFLGTVTARGVDITLGDANDLRLGDIDASGDLDVLIPGALRQAPVDDNITVEGATTLTAALIGLSTPTGNDFDTDGSGDKLTATATGGTLAVDDINGLTLGEISATGGNIRIRSGGELMVMADVTHDNGATGFTTLIGDNDGVGGDNIVFTDGVTVSTTGRLNLLLGGTGSLADGADNGAGGVTLTSGTAGGGNAFILPQTDFSALDLTINADGSITQSASATLMARLTATTTADPITLNNAGNDFSGAVAATGSTVSITDATALVLGNIDADNLILATGGAITQVSGATVDAPVTATTTGGAITLKNFGNVIPTLTADTTVGGAAAANVTVGSAGGIELDDIDADRLIVTARGGNLTDAGATVAGAGINATRATLTATAGNVIVDDQVNDFTDAVIARGTTVTVTDANSIFLADVDAVTLTVNALGGSISQTATEMDGDAVDATGTATFNATGNATLDNERNDFVGAVTADAVDVVLSDTNAIELDDIDADGSLTVAAGGPITQTSTPAAADEAINVGTTTDLNSNGAAITLASAFNDFVGAVTAAGDSISLRDIATLTLGDIDADGNLTAQAGTAITQVADGDNVTVAGTTALTAPTISLTEANDFDSDNDGDAVTATASAGSVTLNDEDNVTLGATSATNGITITADGGITPTADITSLPAGSVTLTADNDGSGSGRLTLPGGITISAADALNLASGGIGAVRDSGTGTVTLNTGSTFELPKTTFLTVDLVINADGAITQALAPAVLNRVTANTTGDAITLATPTNQIGVFAADTTIGGAPRAAVNVADGGALTLGDITASNLTLRSGDDVTQETGSAIDASATTTLNVAGAAILGNAVNDLTTVSGVAESVSIVETDGVAVGTLTAGSVNVTSDADVLVTTSVRARESVRLRSTGTGTVGASNGATIRADSDGDFSGDVSLNSAGGLITGGTGSSIQGVNVLMSGGSTDTNAVRTTDGDITVTATATTVTLNGPTNASNDVIVTAETAATIAGGGSARALSVDAQDVNASGPAFTTVDGVTLTNAAEDNTQLGGAEDASTTTFEISEAGLNVFAGGGITVEAGNGTITSGGAVDLINAGTTNLVLLAPGVGDVTVAGLIADDLTVNSGAGTTDFDGTSLLEGNLVVTANAVTQDAADTLEVSFGTTSVTATNDVTLAGTANDFAGKVDISGATITVNDANDLTFGTVTARTALNANSVAGSILDTAGEAIAAPTATLSAGAGDVILDNDQRHDFDVASITAQSATLNDRDEIDLGNVTQSDVAGALVVIARGAISDSGLIDVEGTTRFETESADGSATITVDGPGGTFGGAVTLNTDLDDNGNRADATLVDNDADLTLGNVTVASATIASAGTGGIRAAGGVQDVEGVATYRANGGDIDLSNDGNDFADTINADADADNNGGAGKITITDANDVELGDIDAAALMVTARNGAITDDGAGNAPGADVNVDGDTMLTATGDITLDDSGTNFVGSVDASGAQVTLVDEDALILGDVTAASLTATTGGAISDVTGKVVDVAGLTTLNAAGSDITLDAAHDFDGRVDATGESITLNDVSRLVLGTIDANVALVAAAQTGSIADTAGRAITAPTATLTANAGDVNLDNDSLHDFDTVNARARSITLNDVDDLDLGRVAQTDAARSLRVTAQGPITDSNAVTAQGRTELRTASADITFDTATSDFVGKVTLDTDLADSGTRADATLVDSAGALILGSVTAQDATISSTGAGGIDAAMGVQDIAGEASYSTNNTPILLTNNSNEFIGKVDLTGGAVTLVDATALVLGSVTVSALDATTLNGAITDTDAEAIVVSGATALDARGSDIALDNVDLHDFAAIADLSAAGNNITIDDLSGIQLGALTAGNDLTINAGGAITQTAVASVLGNTDVNNAGFDVTLDQANDLAGLIALEGANITLRNVPTNSDTTLGDIDASGNLEVSSPGGDIGDGGAGAVGEDINVTGTTTITGLGVVLNDAANDFGGAVNVTAEIDVLLNDINDIVLGNIATTTSPADVRVTAGGSITDNANASITTEELNLRANNGAITLTEDHDVDALVATAATGLTFSDSDDLSLDGITAGGAVSVTADSLTVTEDVTSTGGTVRLATRAGEIAVDGGTNIIADGVLTLDPVGGTLTDGAAGAPIMLVSGGGFVLPATDLALLDLVLMADGSVTQTVPSSILGRLDVSTAGGDILLDQSNTFGTVSADTTKGGAARAEVRLADGTSGLTLDTIIASALTATSNGDLVDVDNTAGTAIQVTGASVFASGPGAVVLDNPNHDFGGGVTATATTGVTLADINDLTLATIASPGQISIAAGRDLIISDPIITNEALALTAGRNVRVEAAVDTQGNALTLTADTSGNNIGSLAVLSSGSLAAGAVTASAAERVTLRNIIASSLQVSDAGSVRVASGPTDISGALRIVSRGIVVDDATASLSVGGRTAIRAPGNRVTLDSATNDFVGAAVIESADSLTLRDENDLTVEATTIDGQIDLLAAGTVTLDDALISRNQGVRVRANDDIIVSDMSGVQAGQPGISLTADLDGDGAGSVLIGEAELLSPTTVRVLAGENIVLDSVRSGSLVAQAGGSITAKGASIDTTTSTNMRAGGDITVTTPTVRVGTDLTLRADSDNNGAGAINIAATSNTRAQNVNAAAGGDIVLGETVARGTMTLRGDAITFGGHTDVYEALDITARGTVSDVAGIRLLARDTTTISARGQSVLLDNANNDFRDEVRAAADRLSIRDINALELTESTIRTDSRVTATGGDLTISRSDLATARLQAGNEVAAEDVTGNAVTVVATGPATVARFSVEALNITAGDLITLTEGAASTGITLNGDVDANLATVLTPSLTAADLAVASLDRVGATNAVLDIAADEIALGVVRAQSANLQATAGDIQTADSTAGSVIQVARPDGSTLDVSTTQIAATNRLLDVSGPLAVRATGDVALTKALNSGATVNNLLRNVVVDGTVGGALTIETRDDIAISRSAPVNTVGSANVIGTKSVSLDVDALANARAESTGIAADNVAITGEVGGNATAEGAGDATIAGVIGGNADATAGQDASISNSVGGNATAIATAGDATITGSVTGNAIAEAGDDASIAGVIGGNADATGGQNASISNSVGGNANATATAGDASISGLVTENATAEAGRNAAINGGVGGLAEATAGNDASIEGTVDETATATAGNDALIDASVSGSATADAAAGRNAVLRGSVNGDATVTAARDGSLDADVTGRADVTARGNADASGSIEGDVLIRANGAIALAANDPLSVGGTLSAVSDANESGSAASITQASAVTVVGQTVLNANRQSDIALGNTGNDFTEVAVLNAAKVDLVDSDTLDIADISNISGDVTVEARDGKLTLSDPDGDVDYRIAADRLWTLIAEKGDISLEGQIDGATSNAANSSLIVRGGDGSTIRVKNLVGSRAPLDEVNFINGENLIFGLKTDADFTNRDALGDNNFLLTGRAENDIFFVNRLNIRGVRGDILLLVPVSTEFTFDFEDRYVGLNIAQQNGFTYDGGANIDLFGSIGNVRSRAAGLSPLGPRGGNSEFNNCLIGDPNSCSALTQANVLRLVDLTPENVFVLDPDQVEQLFLSFGNEELWGLPSVFAIDIEDDEEDEDEDGS